MRQLFLKEEGGKIISRYDKVVKLNVHSQEIIMKPSD